MLGLIIAVVVTAAATDNTIRVRLLDEVVAHTPTVTKAFVVGGARASSCARTAIRRASVLDSSVRDT